MAMERFRLLFGKILQNSTILIKTALDLETGHFLTYKAAGKFFSLPRQWDMFAPPLKRPFVLMTFYFLPYLKFL